MLDKEKLIELQECKVMIESHIFQEYIVKPLREYQDRLKDAYSCDSLKELWNIKGKKDGSEEFFRILKKINKDLGNTKFEIENSD